VFAVFSSSLAELPGLPLESVRKDFSSLVV